MELVLQVFQVIGPVVIATIFIVMIKADVKIVSVKLEGITENLKVLNRSFDKLGDILTKVAVQDQRIANLESDIKELRHGRGFISIDGEYRSIGKVSG